MRKLLWVGEATFLNTGYAVYAREILSRLMDTHEYMIAELGCYGEVYDERRYEIPWIYYGNMPTSQQEHDIYASNIANQWGAWRFEEVLLDFQPDIVMSCRDPWVDKIIAESPLRKYFTWIYMPTVDSIPQSPQMVDTISNADYVLAYSEFGANELQKICADKFSGIASPSADYKIFKPPHNKEKHKSEMGFKSNIKIVGTIMRNQKRKLFPDIIEAFEKFVNDNPELSENVYLYMHTNAYDIGWDIPRLIRESRIGHKILLTYCCEACGCCFPSFLHGPTQTCIDCGRFTAKLSSTDFGASAKQLAEIIQCFDVYVQYSICEGWGLSIIEAIACGVPAMAVDYSAMSSHIKHVCVIPIKVERFFIESETLFKRAYPDNNDLAQKLAWFFRKPQSEIKRIAQKMYLACIKYCNWDKSANVWKSVIDKSPQSNWSQPAIIHEIPQEIPLHLPYSELIDWLSTYVLNDPDFKYSYIAQRMLKDLEIGKIPVGGVNYNDADLRSQSFISFTKANVIREFIRIAENKIYWERRRLGQIKENIPRFITDAKR